MRVKYCNEDGEVFEIKAPLSDEYAEAVAEDYQKLLNGETNGAATTNRHSRFD